MNRAVEFIVKYWLPMVPISLGIIQIPFWPNVSNVLSSLFCVFCGVYLFVDTKKRGY